MANKLIETELFMLESKKLNLKEAGCAISAMPAIHQAILAYTPDYCGFVSWDGNAFKALGKESEFKESDVFEFRCFCNEYELRWVCDSGKAALISERKIDVPGFTDVELDVEDEPGCKTISKLENRYMLWGKASLQNGLICLSEHRVKPIWLSADAKVEDDKVYLKFTEYFSQDEYGNFIFKYERLSGIQNNRL